MRSLAAFVLLACSTPAATPRLDKTEAVPLASVGPRDRSVAAGQLFSCALDEGLVCWGSGFHVPFPTDPVRSPRMTTRDPPLGPHRVLLPGPPVAVAAGDHGCVLLEGGEVRCWVSDAYGQLARGGCEAGFFLTPLVVPLGEPATDVAALGTSSCALLEGGRVACWGNVHSERASPDGCSVRSVLTASGEPLRGIVRLEVGAGIDAEGRVWTWRDQSLAHPRGDEADRPTLEATRARLVAGLPPAFDVAVTGAATFALTGKGALWQLAEGELERVDAPRMGRRLACEYYQCVMATDGPLLGWTMPTIESRADLVDGFDVQPRSLAVGRGGGLVERDATRCWGSSLWGVVPEADIPTAGLVTVR